MSTLRGLADGASVLFAPEGIEVGFLEVFIAGSKHPLVALRLLRFFKNLDRLEFVALPFVDGPLDADHLVFFFAESCGEELAGGGFGGHAVVVTSKYFVLWFKTDDRADLFRDVIFPGSHCGVAGSLVSFTKLLLSPTGESCFGHRSGPGHLPRNWRGDSSLRNPDSPGNKLRIPNHHRVVDAADGLGSGAESVVVEHPPGCSADSVGLGPVPALQPLKLVEINFHDRHNGVGASEKSRIFSFNPVIIFWVLFG